ncbi:MAG TPA: sugar phosphate isomerase/epimerase family protein [Bryobacteraceae bacterium]|nr:sugar phosphate isomerase/epimerase family protein [Bryobacteraceae bacterium]
MTRREILLSSALAAMAKAQTPPTVRFGVRSPLPETGLRERAKLVASLGFDGIELGHEWVNQPLPEIQKMLDGTGVAVSAIVGSIGLLDTDPAKRAEAVVLDRKRLEMARALGAGFLIEVPVFGPNKFAAQGIPDAWKYEEKLVVEGLRQLIPDVRRTGVTILLEPCNHKETHFMNKQSQAAEMIQAVNAPGFKTLSDFYHMQIEEKDIGVTLSKFGRYTGYVHLADGTARTEPGSLPFDYRPGFHALKKAGFHGWLTIESKPTDAPAPALARALKYLKRQWAEA